MVATAIGAFLGIGILAYLAMEMDAPMLMASFGATAVLIYGAPKSPLAAPKNVFFGHLFSAVVGTAVSMLLGCTWFSAAIAVALAILVMMVTGTVHPPGGATALVCILSDATPSFILAPVMVGALVLLAVELISNAIREREEKTG